MELGLGLFAELSAKAMTGRNLQATLQLHQSPNPDFFDTLMALHFLERDGNGQRPPLPVLERSRRRTQDRKPAKRGHAHGQGHVRRALPPTRTARTLFSFPTPS